MNEEVISTVLENGAQEVAKPGFWASLWAKYGLAIVVVGAVILIALGIWFFTRKKKNQQPAQQPAQQQEQQQQEQPVQQQQVQQPAQQPVQQQQPAQQKPAA